MLWEILVKHWVEFLLGLFFTGLGVGLRKVVKTIRHLNAANDAYKAASRSLLRDRIVQAYTYFSVRQSWSLQSRDSTFDMYEQYKKLDGNGSVAHLMEVLQKLPIDTGKEESA